jgi:plastocyanin
MIRRMARWTALLALVAGLALAAPAGAETRTLTLRYGPVHMGGYNVEFPKAPVRAPRLDGYVTHMSASLVDRRGRPITIRDVMLHHLVFHHAGPRPELGPCTSRGGEAIYGTGEENEDLRLPAGYGYRVAKADRWRITAMLMSHSERSIDAYIRYTVTVVTGRAMKAVEPFWVRANGCGAQVSYAVLGGGGPGSTYTRSYDWKVPFDGRIVAAGGHLHGGARDMWMSQPRCGNRRILDNAPHFGMPDHIYYRARPILHEPGPFDTRYFMSRTGIAVRKGEIIRLNAGYDNSAPHPRVMAIAHVYVVPDRALPKAAAACAPLPADAVELTKPGPFRAEPPAVPVPLNRIGKDGRTETFDLDPAAAKPVRSGSTVELEDLKFSPSHIRIAVGGSVRWRFADAIAHNVLFASGPRLVGSPTLSHGQTYTTTFTAPGHYELFCYLHPMTMHETVEVTG